MPAIFRLFPGVGEARIIIPCGIVVLLVLKHSFDCARCYFRHNAILTPVQPLLPMMLAALLGIGFVFHWDFWFLLLGLIPVYLLFFQLNLWQFPRMLRREFARFKKLCDTEPTAEPVDTADYPFLDLAAYDRARQWYRSAGFVELGDFRNLAMDEVFDGRCLIARNALSPDRTIVGEFEHLYQREWLAQPFLNHRNMTFMTEFDNGTFLETGTTLGFNKFTRFDGITLLQVPEATDIDEVYRIHCEAIAVIGEDDGPQPITIHSTGELRASIRRRHLLFRADRYRKEFITEEEFADIIGQVENSANRIFFNQFRRIRSEFCGLNPPATS